MDGSKKRLAEILAAYGADPKRWPAAESDRLETLIERHPELASEAAEIDLVLSRASAPQVSDGASARLLARSAKPAAGRSAEVIPLRREKSIPWSSGWSWATGAALAASLACGVFMGTIDFTDLLGDPDSVEIDDAFDLTGIRDATDLLDSEG